MEEALNWVKYTGDVTILPKLGAVDNCWPMLSIFFTECKYQCFKLLLNSKECIYRYITGLLCCTAGIDRLLEIKYNKNIKKLLFNSVL